MDETHWVKHLLMGLLALAVGTMLLGGVGSMLTLRAAELVGVTPTGESREDRKDVQDGKDGKGGEDTKPRPAPQRPRMPKTTTAVEERPADPAGRKVVRSSITLQASPDSAAPYDRVDLTGTYAPSGAPGDISGAQLQVQRLDNGSWTDFPVTVTLTGRTFSTYLQTGRVGVNRFRLQDSAGRISNVVIVRIG